MRTLVLLTAACLLAAAAPATQPGSAPSTPDGLPMCHAPAPGAAPPAPVLLTGYGTGGFAIRTAKPEAQVWFDNGMQLGHAFAHKASIAAFARARALDPTCAMCAWGEGWARGPTINYGIDKTEQAKLALIADQAAKLGAGGPDWERTLIAALQLRYRDGGGQGRGDHAFARAMDALARAYPDDNELAVLAADAWMIPSAGRRSRDNLPRAVALLEGALARNPNDTGAIHFYIHATEMSGFGPRALPYAERLQALAPSASHLVHMPSHTFFWVGRYRQAEQANLDAAKLDHANAVRLKPKDGVYGLTYHRHNVHFGTIAGLMDGDAAGALSLARGEVAELSRIKPADGFAQATLGAAYAAFGRYADAGDMAALRDPGAALPLARALWRYGRGEAAARRGDSAAVRAEAAEIAAVRPAALKALGWFGKTGGALVEVARLVLAGRADMLDDTLTRRRSRSEGGLRCRRLSCPTSAIRRCSGTPSAAA